MPNAPRLSGIFTPNIVPLDSAGEINEAELRRYTDWLIDRGVHGLYPNGSTGEFTRFTVEERRRIIEIMADQTARPRADSGRRGRGERPRDDPRLRVLSFAGRPGRGDRLAVLLQAQPAERVRLLQRDRRQHAGRRDALQHSDVRLADRRPDRAAAERRLPADRGDQGFVRRSAAHDSDDRGRAAEPSRLCVSDRVGRGA